MSNDLQKFYSKYYSKDNFPEKFNFKKNSKQSFPKLFNSKIIQISFFFWNIQFEKLFILDFWRNSIEKYYSKQEFFLDSIQKDYSKPDFFLDLIQKNIHSIPNKEYHPWLGRGGRGMGRLRGVQPSCQCSLYDYRGPHPIGIRYFHISTNSMIKPMLKVFKDCPTKTHLQFCFFHLISVSI